jgi:hypothetical protein
LRREIGVGSAKIIKEIEIRWHGSNKIQQFRNILPNQFIRITEGSEAVNKINLKKIQWQIKDELCRPLPSVDQINKM